MTEHDELNFMDIILSYGNIGRLAVDEFSSLDEANEYLQNQYMGKFQDKIDFLESISYGDIMELDPDEEPLHTDQFDDDFIAIKERGKIHVFKRLDIDDKLKSLESIDAWSAE